MTAMRPPFSEARRIAEWCHALSNPKRVQVLLLLDRDGPHTVTEVAERLGMELSNASRALTTLHAVGLVNRSRVGHGISYATAHAPAWISLVENRVAGATPIPSRRGDSLRD